MNLKKNFMYLILSVILVYLGMCTLPSNPGTNPEYAGIDDENISTLPSKAPMGTFYNCTLTVFLPSLVDSFIVKKSTGTVSSLVASGDSVGDTLFFTIDFLQPDDYTINIILYKAEYTDTLQKHISIYSTIPTCHFSETKYVMNFGQVKNMPYSISDPDSNLLSYYVHRNGIRTDTIEVKVANRSALDGFVVPDSGCKLQKVNCYSIDVIDVDSQYSRSALCTLTVVDAVFPRVSMVNIVADSAFTVTTLPCTLGVVITDNWCIDSVKVSGLQQSIPEGDTLRIVKTFLNTGVTADSIEVWDRAANRAVVKFALKYNGVVTYPPKLKPVSIKPIFEHGKFDTLLLDTIVTITDTSATYSKDVLAWTISVDVSDSLIKKEYDPASRKLYVNVPDGEIGHDRQLSLSIMVTDPKGKSDKLQRVDFWVFEQNDTPVVKINNQVKVFGDAFDTLVLDKCGSDPDQGDRISWKIDAGKYFKPDSIYSTLKTLTFKSTTVIKNPLRTFTGKVAIVPDTTKFKPSTIPITTLELVDSLKFTATDGNLTAVKYVRFIWRRLQLLKTDALLSQISR